MLVVVTCKIFSFDGRAKGEGGWEGEGEWDHRWTRRDLAGSDRAPPLGGGSPLSCGHVLWLNPLGFGRHDILAELRVTAIYYLPGAGQIPRQCGIVLRECR